MLLNSKTGKLDIYYNRTILLRIFTDIFHTHSKSFLPSIIIQDSRFFHIFYSDIIQFFKVLFRDISTHDHISEDLKIPTRFFITFLIGMLSFLKIMFLTV